MQTRIILAALATVLALLVAPGLAPAQGLIGCVYNTSPPSPSNGQRVPCQVDSQGRIILAPSAQSLTLLTQSTSAAAATLVVKATPGTFFGGQATAGATAGFVLLFDAASAPADGAVTPKKCWVAPANQTTVMAWGDVAPLQMATGITIVFSSTGCFTKTGSATAFISGDYQ